MGRSSRRSRLRPLWLISLCAIAALQVVALGWPGSSFRRRAWSGSERPGIPDWQRAIAILASSALAAYLLLGARRDERVEHLGAFFLLVAVFFANTPIWALVR